MASATEKFSVRTLPYHLNLVRPAVFDNVLKLTALRNANRDYFVSELRGQPPKKQERDTNC